MKTLRHRKHIKNSIISFSASGFQFYTKLASCLRAVTSVYAFEDGSGDFQMKSFDFSSWLLECTHTLFSPPPLKLSRDARDVTAPAPRRVIALRINWETCGFTGWTLIVLLREKINGQLLRFMCAPCNQSPTMRKCVKNYGGRYFERFTAVVLSGAKSGSFFKSQLC